MIFIRRENKKTGNAYQIVTFLKESYRLFASFFSGYPHPSNKLRKRTRPLYGQGITYSYPAVVAPLNACRKIEDVLRDRISFMWLSANQAPDHNTINQSVLRSE
jgi:hypothetical protein